VYCAGHGVADQQQYFVLNDSKRQLVTIEAKLRALANLTGASIMAVYDVCRQNIETVKELKRGVKTDDLFGDEYSYCHICTQPGQLVDADSCMADDINDHLHQMAKEDDYGVLNFPKNILTVQSVEKTVNGPAYKIKWNPNI